VKTAVTQPGLAGPGPGGGDRDARRRPPLRMEGPPASRAGPQLISKLRLSALKNFKVHWTVYTPFTEPKNIYFCSLYTL
jgi:hypothetical protein